MWFMNEWMNKRKEEQTKIMSFYYEFVHPNLPDYIFGSGIYSAAIEFLRGWFILKLIGLDYVNIFSLVLRFIFSFFFVRYTLTWNICACWF